MAIELTTCTPSVLIQDRRPTSEYIRSINASSERNVESAILDPGTHLFKHPELDEVAQRFSCEIIVASNGTALFRYRVVDPSLSVSKFDYTSEGLVTNGRPGGYQILISRDNPIQLIGMRLIKTNQTKLFGMVMHIDDKPVYQSPAHSYHMDRELVLSR